MRDKPVGQPAWSAEDWYPPVKPPAGFIHFKDIWATYSALKELWRTEAFEQIWTCWRMARGRSTFPAFDFIAGGLLTGQLRAAGSVMEDGSLVWIPAATWERPTVVDSETCSPVMAVMVGQPLVIRAAGHRELSVYPLLQTRDLAEVCRAERLPPVPPDWILGRVREMERTAARETAACLLDKSEVARPRAGPRPEVLKRVMANMQSALERGELTAAQLADLKKVELPGRFSGKETTCMKAREMVLRSAANCDQTPNNDK